MIVVPGLLAGLAAAVLCWRPPEPARIRELSAGRARHRDRAAPEPDRWLVAVGRALRVHVLRRRHSGSSSDRALGAAAALTLVAVVLDPVLAGLLAAAAAVTARWLRLRRGDQRHRRRAIETDLPELVDLLALAVAAGLTVPESLRAAEPCAPPGLRHDVSDAVDAIAAGGRVEEALDRLGGCWGEPGRPLVHTLIDHVRYGTPLLPSLERVAAEARTRRRRSAEMRARRLPVLLLFPLVLCTLPAFGLLTVAPLVAGTLGSLTGSPLEAPASTAP